MSASASIASRLDPGVPEKAEQLAAAAADVEHGRGVAEVVDVRALPLADVGGRAAHPRLEREVVGHGSGCGLGGDGRGRALAPPRRSTRVSRSSSSPRVRAASSRGRSPRSTSSSDPVDHLQHDVVEHPLLGRERLDVPAQERPQDPLQRVGDPALRAGPPLERPVGGDGPEPLGAVAGGEQLPAPLASPRSAPPAISSRSRSTSAFTSTSGRGRNRCRGRRRRLGPGHRIIVRAAVTVTASC